MLFRSIANLSSTSLGKLQSKSVSVGNSTLIKFQSTERPSLVAVLQTARSPGKIGKSFDARLTIVDSEGEVTPVDGTLFYNLQCKNIEYRK